MTEQDKNKVLDFDIDMSMFTNSLKSNFQRLWECVQKNRNGVQQCKEKINALSRTRSPMKIDHRKNSSKQIELDFSDNSAAVIKQFQSEAHRLQENDMNMRMTQSRVIGHDQFRARSKGSERGVEAQNQKGIETEDFRAQSKESKRKTEMHPPPVLPKKQKIVNNSEEFNKQYTMNNKQGQKEQAKDIKQVNPQEESLPYRESINAFKNIELKDSKEIQLIQNKIFEMNERVANLEMNSTKELGFTSRKFNTLQNEIQKNNQVIAKSMNQVKFFQKEVDNLRNELSEYKLKKQAKLMKMTNKMDNSTVGSDSSNYIVQKLQFLTKYVNQLVTKEQFNQENESLSSKIEQIKKKMGQTVTNQQFHDILRILDKKFSNRNSRQIGRVTTTQLNRNSNKSQEVPQEQGEESFLGSQIKLIQYGKKIHDLQQLTKEQFESQKNNQKKNDQKVSELLKNLQELSLQTEKGSITMKDHEKFMRDMNTNYNQKFKEVENQIIQSQETIEKINSQIKFYNFTSSKSEANTTLGNAPSTSALDPSRNVELENEVAQLKKKVNKTMLKHQNIKQDMLSIRQDFSREVDGIKMNLEKKCDWESLKKGLNYFEDKVKDVSESVNQILEQMQNSKNQESTAAKRGWTCLCCDKDIKQYEGKLNEAKFTNIFPTRYESPRIGGYYKQKQSTKEYNQLYLKHNRKLSNPSKTKEQII